MTAISLKAATIQRFTSLHSWTGITTGILLFVAFYAGSLSLFKDEISLWADPHYQHELQEIAEGNTHTAQQLLDGYVSMGNIEDNFFLILGDENYRPYLSIVKNTPDGRMRSSLYEPKGELINHNPDQRSAVANFIELLHFTMGLPTTFGTYLFGLVTLLYGIALISGLVIHLPDLAKYLFSIHQGRNSKKLWKDAHNVIGVISLPFHLMYIVTTLLLTVSILALLGTNFFTLGNQIQVENSSALFEVAPHPKDSEQPADMLAVSQLVASAKKVFPYMEPYSINYQHYGTDTAAALIRGPYPASIIGFASIQVSATTGETQGASIPGQHNPFLATSSIIGSLHFGQFGDGLMNTLVRIAYFVLGLLGAFLFYSGNLLWIETRRKRRSPTQPSHHFHVARLTLAGCLGTVVGISAMLMVAKLLPTEFEFRGIVERGSWYACLTLSLVWVYLRPIWRSAVELLLLSALLTAALPLANWLVYLPPWQSFLHVPSVFWMDVCFIIMAIGFGLLTKATQRRALQGQTNSIWSAISTSGPN